MYIGSVCQTCHTNTGSIHTLIFISRLNSKCIISAQYTVINTFKSSFGPKIGALPVSWTLGSCLRKSSLQNYRFDFSCKTLLYVSCLQKNTRLVSYPTGCRGILVEKRRWDPVVLDETTRSHS